MSTFNAHLPELTPFTLNQVSRRIEFRHASLVKYDDSVVVDDRIQTMSDYDKLGQLAAASSWDRANL